jgi:hypothetical protein
VRINLKLVVLLIFALAYSTEGGVRFWAGKSQRHRGRHPLWGLKAEHTKNGWEGLEKVEKEGNTTLTPPIRYTEGD